MDVSKYFKKDIRPVIGEVLHGEYAGLKFALFGKREISMYFTYQNVRKVLSNKRMNHKGCSFRYATFEEAIPYADKLSLEIVASLSPIHLERPKRNKEKSIN